VAHAAVNARSEATAVTVRRLMLCTAVWWDRGGAETNRLQRMRHVLRRLGVETVVTALSSDPDSGRGWSVADDTCGSVVRYRSTPSSLVYPSPAMRRVFGASRFHREHGDALLRRFECEALLVYTSQAPLAEACVELARRHRLPVLADAAEYHGFTPHYALNGVNLQQWLFRHRVVPRLDGLVGVGRGWCAWAERAGVPTAWVPAFGVRPAVVRKRVARSDEPIRLAFIGHWVRRECPDVLIAGLGAAVAAGVDLTVDVLGKPHRSYRERVWLRAVEASPHLRERIHFRGFVSDDERDRYLAYADLFVLLRPADQETEHLFPTRLPEYLASGNPVVLSATPTFRSCFTHGRDAWLLEPPVTASALTEAIVELAATPGQRYRIGAEGQARGLELFNDEQLGVRMGGLLAAAVTRCRGRFY
jgi:glycosyltransferase involved in cell wall biosynthesis